MTDSVETIGVELLKIARQVISAIKIDESGDEFVVTGPYNEMKDVFPHLKKMGFRYNGTDRSWRLPLSHMTDDKRRKVDELISGAKDIAATMSQSVAQKMEGEKWSLFKVIMTNSFVSISGGDKDFQDFLYHVGARRSTDGMHLPYSALTEKSLDDIVKRMKEWESVEVKNRKEVLDYAKHNLDRKNFVGGDVQTWLDKGRVTGQPVLVINSADKKYRDSIKDCFTGAKWDGQWRIALSRTDKAEIDKFLSEMNKWEKSVREETQTIYHGNKVTFSFGSGYKGRIWFGKGDVIKNFTKGLPDFLYVVDIKERYFSEDGLSFGVGADRGWIYTVNARPATDAESADLRQKEEDKKTRGQAMSELVGIAKDIENGEYPQGDNRANGVVVFLDSKTLHYGGGSWFTLEEASWIWFVRNNGADGDDWSRNNVLTGGAGGIGHRVRWDDGLAERILKLAKVAGLEIK